MAKLLNTYSFALYWFDVKIFFFFYQLSTFNYTLFASAVPDHCSYQLSVISYQPQLITNHKSCITYLLTYLLTHLLTALKAKSGP